MILWCCLSGLQFQGEAERDDGGNITTYHLRVTFHIISVLTRLLVRMRHNIITHLYVCVHYTILRYTSACICVFDNVDVPHLILLYIHVYLCAQIHLDFSV